MRSLLPPFASTDHPRLEEARLIVYEEYLRFDRPVRHGFWCPNAFGYGTYVFVVAEGDVVLDGAGASFGERSPLVPGALAMP